MKNALSIGVFVLSLITMWQFYTSAGYHKQVREDKDIIEKYENDLKQLNNQLLAVNTKNKEIKLELDKYEISFYIFKTIDSSSAKVFEQVYYSETIKNIK
jgi:hypothetical protein